MKDPKNPVDTGSPEALRAFVRLCLNPGIGNMRRSPEQFARIMPDWIAGPLAEHVPQLAEPLGRLSAAQDAVELALTAVTDARTRFAAELRLWIEDEPAAPAGTDEAAAPGDTEGAPTS